MQPSTRGQLFRQLVHAPRLREVIQFAAHGLAGLEDVGRRQRPVVVPALREQVAAEQRFRAALEQVPALPGMRQVRGVDPAHRVAAQREFLAVGQGAGRTQRDVVHAGHFGDLAAQRLGRRRQRQEVVERAALVGLEMGKADVAQVPHRQHGGDGLADQRKQFVRPAVVEQRAVIHDQVLVEGKSAGHRARRYRRADAIDAVGDFVDARTVLLAGFHRFTPGSRVEGLR
ncbi:MAG: hypothetical protein MUE63_12175 [Xanthomonadales bacterium]|nr:hypothetical protein [Xanthomonadales bacterium]